MIVHDLTEQTHDWTDAGLITPEQASAIRVHEARRETPSDTPDETSDVAAHQTPRGAPHPAATAGLPRWVEPLAYLGVALVAVALALFAAQVWEQIAAWAQVVLAGLVAVGLLASGALLGPSGQAPARRAGALAWLLSLTAVASTVGLLLASVVEADDDTVLLVTTGVTAMVAMSLYALMRTGLQQIGLVLSLAAFATSVAQVTWWPDAESVPLVLAALGIVWLGLSAARQLEPPMVGWVVGSLLVLAVGLAATVNEQPFWAALGVAVALGLVYLATVLDSRWVLAVAVLGLVVWVPVTVTMLFQGSVAVPIAILVTGAVTLGVVVVAVRGRLHVDDG